MMLSARTAVMVMVIPVWDPVTRTWAEGAAAVTVTVFASGAQASMSEADSAVIVTVCALGAQTTRPLGRVAVTVTCLGVGGTGEKAHWSNRLG